MKFNLFSNLSSSQEHFRRCLLWFVVLSVVLVSSVVITIVSKPEPPVVYVTEKRLTIESDILPKKTVKTRVDKGEQLKVFGYRVAGYYDQPSLWVETSDGVRGLLSVVQLDVPLRAWNTRTESMDEVTLLSIDNEEWRYKCRFSDGEVCDLEFTDVEPVLPDSLTRNLMPSDGSTYNYMSRDKFERIYLGATFEDNDQAFQPANAVTRYKDSLRATYPVSVIDVKSGKRYRPMVTYDKSQVAVSYTLDWENDRSAWFISKLPLMQSVIDNPLVSFLLEGSCMQQTPIAGVEANNQEWWEGLHWYVLAALVLLPVFIWLFLTPFLPTLLIGVLLHFRRVFYPLGNRSMLLLTLIVTLFSTYIWILAMLAWGMIDVFLLIYLWPMYKFYILVVRPLWYHVPPMRCRGCRSLETYKHTKTELVQEYDKWFKESEVRKKLSEDTERWRTWKETTTTYTDGSKSTSKSDFKNHSKTTTTYLYDDYDVLYHVMVYKSTYECSFCGELVHYPDTQYKEKDRKYRGQHTSTSTSYSES